MYKTAIIYKFPKPYRKSMTKTTTIVTNNDNNDSHQNEGSWQLG